MVERRDRKKPSEQILCERETEREREEKLLYICG